MNNNQNNHSLIISQQYPAENYNLLVPMQTVAEIAEIHRPVMNCVTISTNLDDKEIYEQDKKAHLYAITKKGLNKLMRAAGIKMLSSRPVVPSTCQKCAEVNRSIGRPVNCGSCGNKDVKYEVRIGVPQLTGENIEVVAHKEIIVQDVTAGMTEFQQKEFLKFRNEMCETKAINRALRAAMHIKGTYRIEEFKKPFVVAYLVPNLDNPDVKAEAVKNMFAASKEIYGTHNPDARKTLYVDDDVDEYGRGEYEATAGPIVQTQPYEQTPQQAQAAPPPQQQAADNFDPNTCQDCGTRISDGVSRFAMRNYEKPLCMNCQKKYERGN